jgi:hypothetical protein
MSDMLTVQQVAELLNCSVETVTRRFAKLPGVLDLGGERKGRRYRVLRIPLSVVEKFAGRRFVPPNAASTRKPLTEEELMKEFAAMARRQTNAKKFVDNMASHARMLAVYVPLDEWDGLVWLDDDEDVDQHGRIVAVGPLRK